MKQHIARLTARRRGGEIGDAVYASLYFLHWQVALHGRRFASRKFKRDPRPHCTDWLRDLDRIGGAELRERLIHYFERYGYLGVIPNVPAALCAWLAGRWSLILCEHVPSPAEVLHMQVLGTRPVTILSEYPRCLRPVLKKANAHAFMIHDLEHAYKYFYDPYLHDGQKRFFAGIYRAVRQGDFDVYRRDPTFADKFDYLISDMNTHVMHSLQFLRAILIEHRLRREQKRSSDSLSAEAREEIDAILRPLCSGLHWGTDGLSGCSTSTPSLESPGFSLAKCV